MKNFEQKRKLIIKLSNQLHFEFNQSCQLAFWKIIGKSRLQVISVTSISYFRKPYLIDIIVEMQMYT